MLLDMFIVRRWKQNDVQNAVLINRWKTFIIEKKARMGRPTGARNVRNKIKKCGDRISVKKI